MSVYVHQVNSLRSAAAPEFYEAMREHYVPAMVAAGVRLVGCWETLEEQGPWPQTLELWEYDGFGHLNSVLAAKHSRPGHPLKAWTVRRSEWIASSQSHVCLKSDRTPTVAARAEAGWPTSPLVLHETMTVSSTRQAEYLRALEDFYLPRVAEPAGRTLIGLYYSPWKATSAFNLWGLGADWQRSALASDETGFFPGRDTELWVSLGREIRSDWDDRLMVPIALL